MSEVYDRYPFEESEIPWERVCGQSVDNQEPMITTFKEEIDVPVQEEKTFTTLEANPKKNIDKKNFLDFQENNTLNSWTNVHPLEWKKGEVLDWVFSYGLKNSEDTCMTFSGAAFNEFNGEQLCQMSTEEFVTLEPNHGEDLHRLLQEIIGNIPPNLGDNVPSNLKEEPYIPATVSEIDPASLQSELYVSGLIDAKFVLENDCFLQGDDSAIGIDVTKAFLQDNEYDSSDSAPYPERKYSSSSNFSELSLNISEDSYQEEARRPYTHTSGHTKKQGQQSGLGSDGEEGDPRPKHPTMHRHKKTHGPSMKGNRLWEFMRDMLRDNQHDHLIRWEDKPNGIFRLLKSEEMAKLWGKKKNNDNMTYEKLSRALRFCRKVGYFGEIPKNRGYPKKLVFKFGHKAHGYR